MLTSAIENYRTANHHAANRALALISDTFDLFNHTAEQRQFLGKEFAEARFIQHLSFTAVDLSTARGIESRQHLGQSPPPSRRVDASRPNASLDAIREVARKEWWTFARHAHQG